MSEKSVTVSVEEARRIILESVTPLTAEEIPILDAPGRVLYADIVADIPVPPVDDSAMDGYAITSGDTRGASREHPAVLRVSDEIQAGGAFLGKRVSPGTAIRIMTGAPVPEGADAIVPFEDTEEGDGYVRIFTEVGVHSHYRFAGESIAPGETVLDKGDRLRPADIGLLASLNRDRVTVYRRPTVSIISTGDEVAEVGKDIRLGQIRDVNAYTLYTEARNYGALPEYLGIARDTVEDMKALFLKALHSDVVISTGGVSMGRYDFVKDIYLDLGIDIRFEWVKVKPGRPCTFGKKGDTLFFGLPGNPVSTLTSFLQFVRPALLRLMGATSIAKPVVHAFLTEDIKKPAGKAHLLRGRFTIKDGQFHVSTTGNQKSSVLRSMSRANCLIVLPEGTTRLKAGETVAIELIGHDEI